MFKAGDKIRRMVASSWPNHHGIQGVVYTAAKDQVGSCVKLVETGKDAEATAFELEPTPLEVGDKITVELTVQCVNPCGSLTARAEGAPQSNYFYELPKGTIVTKAPKPLVVGCTVDIRDGFTGRVDFIGKTNALVTALDGTERELSVSLKQLKVIS